MLPTKRLVGFLSFLLAGACAATTQPPHAPLNTMEPSGQWVRKEQHTLNRDARTAVTLPLGVGITRSPNTTMFGAALDLPVGDSWSVGPAVQIGVDDDRNLFSGTLLLKRYFPVSDTGEWSRLTPYALGGVGLVSLEEDVPGGDVDDTEFLLTLGGGARYRLTDQLSIGSQAQLNLVPGEVLDERTYFSWEVLQFVLTF